MSHCATHGLLRGPQQRGLVDGGSDKVVSTHLLNHLLAASLVLRAPWKAISCDSVHAIHQRAGWGVTAEREENKKQSTSRPPGASQGDRGPGQLHGNESSRGLALTPASPRGLFTSYRTRGCCPQLEGVGLKPVLMPIHPRHRHCGPARSLAPSTCGPPQPPSSFAPLSIFF